MEQTPKIPRFFKMRVDFQHRVGIMLIGGVVNEIIAQQEPSAIKPTAPSLLKPPEH
jgi:hypothetical protein